MEMRQNLAELLSSVVSTTYGSFYGAVTTALADRSRSTLADVNRAVPHLSTSDVRLAIVTLVQQHLVNHHTDEHGVAFYEPNWEHAYNFTCRLPTLRKFVEERYDSTVAEIFHDIAQAGVISVGDIITELCGTSAITTDPNHSNADQPNHAVETSARTNGEKQALHELTVQENDIYSALNLLLSAGYLMRVNSRQFWPAYDRDGEANNEIMVVQFPAGAGVKKERDALRMESDKLLRRWRKEDERCVPPGTQTGFQNGRKRDRSPNNNDEDEPAFKRQQTHGNPPVSVEQYRSWLTEHQESLKHDLVVAVNYDKCAVGLRTDMFVRHCERHVNFSAAKVYEALLRNLEPHIPRCHDFLQEKEVEREFFGPEYEKPRKLDIGLSQPITTREVTSMLDPEIHIDEHAPELDDDVVHSVEDSVAAHSNQRNNQENDDTSPAVSTARRAERHLQTLVCDPQGFVQMSQGQWRVPFHPISQRIIEEEIETIITHNLGTLPARMVRILKFYGHQELRHLAARAMVTEDHARTACTELHKSGWIDVMELPRTARREVTKSLWLWSYDVLKARQKCLADCYFTMSRLSMRLQRERQEIERVIDKSERTDVQGNEDKFLGPSEKATLARFEKQTDMIVRQMVRMDEVVAIMRDFSAMEYPHKLWDHGWVHWQSPSPDAAEAKRRADAEGRGDDEADDEDDEGSAEP